MSSWGAYVTATERRRLILLVLGVVAACSVILAVITFALGNIGDRNDFLYELWPAYLQLHGGHVVGFLNATPAYIAAAVWRAPFALLAMAAGAGWRLSFLITAIPCFAALPLFGIWFARRADLDDELTRRMIIAFALFTILEPLVWFAGLLGHPEELVGIAAALAGVLLARDGRLWAALVLAVFAVLNKPGIAEVVPVMLVAARGPLVRPALVLCLAGSVLWAVYNLTPLAHDVPIWHLSVGTTIGGDFFPFQFLWWLGHGNWLVIHEHVLLVPACVAIAAAWWWRWEHTTQNPPSVLWLVALVMAFRTAVEPWDNIYYNLPLVVCLFCLEVNDMVKDRRIPWLTILASAGALLLVPTNRLFPAGHTVQAALYTAAAVPVLAYLTWRAFQPAAHRNLALTPPTPQSEPEWPAWSTSTPT